MDTPDSTKDRPLSRRRLLKALGTGLAAVGLGVPDAARAQQPGAGRRRVSGNMVLATWGGRYSKAMKDIFLTPFSQESGVTAQTVDAPGGFVPMLQAQAKAGTSPGTSWTWVRPIPSSCSTTAWFSRCPPT